MLRRRDRAAQLQVPVSSPETEPYKDIAIAMSDRVDAKVADIDDDDAFDQVFKDVEGETLRQRLVERVDAMPLDQLMEQFAKRLGDPAVNEVLRSRAEREKRMFLIIESFRQGHKIDISLTMPDDLVRVECADVAPTEANGHILELRRVDEERHDGFMFTVIKDSVGENVTSHLGRYNKHTRTALPDHALVKIGSYMVIPNADIEPELDIGSSFAVHVYGGEPYIINLPVHSVTVNQNQFEVWQDSPIMNKKPLNWHS